MSLLCSRAAAGLTMPRTLPKPPPRHAAVEYAQPDYIYRLPKLNASSAASSGVEARFRAAARTSAGNPIFVTPNDPRYRDQWHLLKMQLPATWGTYTTGTKQVKVCMIDSGYYTAHTDLAGARAGKLRVRGRGRQGLGVHSRVSDNAVHCAGVVTNGWNSFPLDGGHGSNYPKNGTGAREAQRPGQAGYSFCPVPNVPDTQLSLLFRSCLSRCQRPRGTRHCEHWADWRAHQ